MLKEGDVMSGTLSDDEFRTFLDELAQQGRPMTLVQHFEGCSAADLDFDATEALMRDGVCHECGARRQWIVGEA